MATVLLSPVGPFGHESALAAVCTTTYADDGTGAASALGSTVSGEGSTVCVSGDGDTTFEGTDGITTIHGTATVTDNEADIPPLQAFPSCTSPLETGTVDCQNQQCAVGARSGFFYTLQALTTAAGLASFTGKDAATSSSPLPETGGHRGGVDFGNPIPTSTPPAGRGADDVYFRTYGTECVTAGDYTPYTAIAADVLAAARSHLKTTGPGISSSPPTRTTLVNLPGPFAAGHPDNSDGRTWSFTVQAAGHIPSAVTGIPHYTWTFTDPGGKTTTVPTTKPGNLYDGTDPRGNPGHYAVLHTWLTTGTGTVHLHTNWTLTYRINGTGRVLQGGALDYDEDEDFTAIEQRARLIDPGTTSDCDPTRACTSPAG